MPTKKQPTRIRKPATTVTQALGNSDSEAIRNAWKVMGAETPAREVAAHLKAKGIRVTIVQVNRMKAGLFAEPAATGRNTLPNDAIETRRREKKKVSAAAARVTKKKAARKKSSTTGRTTTKKASRRRVQNALRVPHA